MTQYNKYNWVICHSDYSIGFDGLDGADWGYTHHELGISFGRTIGSVLLSYLQYFVFFFPHVFLIGTIFIGRSLEHSIDMEKVDTSTYVTHGSPSFKPVTQQ